MAHFSAKAINFESAIYSHINCFKDYASKYKTNHLLITAGMDFAYEHAEANFKFLEKAVYLMSTRSEASNLKFSFSTLDEYF